MSPVQVPEAAPEDNMTKIHNSCSQTADWVRKVNAEGEWESLHELYSAWNSGQEKSARGKGTAFAHLDNKLVLKDSKPYGS